MGVQDPVGPLMTKLCTAVPAGHFAYCLTCLKVYCIEAAIEFLLPLCDVKQEESPS